MIKTIFLEVKSMKELLARCGYRCDLCMAYKPNVEAHPDNPQRLSEGWKRYFGLRVPPEQILCDGCLAENPRLQDQDCPVRPCALEKNLRNCSECASYVCEKLTRRLVFFEEIQKTNQTPISEEDRRAFILPYENGARLEALIKAKKPLSE